MSQLQSNARHGQWKAHGKMDGRLCTFCGAHGKMARHSGTLPSAGQEKCALRWEKSSVIHKSSRPGGALGAQPQKPHTLGWGAPSPLWVQVENEGAALCCLSPAAGKYTKRGATQSLARRRRRSAVRLLADGPPTLAQRCRLKPAERAANCIDRVIIHMRFSCSRPWQHTKRCCAPAPKQPRSATSN